MGLAESYIHVIRVHKRRQAPAKLEKTCRVSLELLDKLTADLPGRLDLRLQLAWVHVSRGYALRQLKRVPDALGEYRTALAQEAKLAPEVATHPGSASAWIDLSFKLGELAVCLGDLKQARRLLERTVDLQCARKLEERPPNFAVQLKGDYFELTTVLVRLGEHAEASRRAAELTRHFPKDILEHIRAGACLTSCALLAEKDQKLSPEKRRAQAESYADQAVSLLRTAIRLGGADTRDLRKNILRGLRHQSIAALPAYPSYQKLLKELEEAALH